MDPESLPSACPPFFFLLPALCPATRHSGFLHMWVHCNLHVETWWTTGFTSPLALVCNLSLERQIQGRGNLGREIQVLCYQENDPEEKVQVVISKCPCPMIFLSHGKTCSRRRARVEISRVYDPGQGCFLHGLKNGTALLKQDGEA